MAWQCFRCGELFEVLPAAGAQVLPHPAVLTVVSTQMATVMRRAAAVAVVAATVVVAVSAGTSTNLEEENENKKEEATAQCNREQFEWEKKKVFVGKESATLREQVHPNTGSCSSHSVAVRTGTEHRRPSNAL